MVQEFKAEGPAPLDRTMEAAFAPMTALILRAAVRLRIVELIGAASGTAPGTAPGTASSTTGSTASGTASSTAGTSYIDVARAAGTHPESTLRLMRTLAALDHLREDAPGTFSVTPAGALLDRDHPGSMAALIEVFTDPVTLRAFDHLDDSVRSGEPMFDAVFGTDAFSYLHRHPELTERFNTAMSCFTGQIAAALPEAYDFGRFGTVADLGGGDGTLISGVLRAHPGLNGILYDTEAGLAQAPATLKRNGVADRCSLVPGDFFRWAPEGADLYILKSVLHDWSDDRAVTVLANCRAAMPPEGRVLILESVLPETVAPDGPKAPYMTDLNMLVNAGGKERTRRQLDEVCERAGLTITETGELPAPRAFCYLEARAL
ncbi:methyltransferase [Streptomyces sp. NPDC050504]|uniref:methyltransferase n=1 Tax=Streptomyces sp. NPDC050504 TaxID=3365618 RepID=UPI00378F4411